MIDLFKFLLGFIVVSAVLYLTYVVFLRYRCKYNLARVYLLSIPIVALLSVSVTFNVIPLSENGESIINTAQTERISALIDDLITDSRSDLPIEEEEVVYSEPSDHIIVENSSVASIVNAVETKELISQVPNPSNKANQSSTINVFNIVLILGAIYLLGLMTRLIILSIQVRKILSIKRWATREKFNDITLYRSGLIETPFSFVRNIFIDRGVAGVKLQMIVQHELSHISNHHYLDKNIVELMSILMWFNPIVWCVRNELGAIHEFQADNNVIEDGVDVKTYQHYLFEEIMGKSPSVANGFNHSLIKKRMIMMMRSRMFKNSVIKTSLAIVSLILIFASVSFKSVEAEIESTVKHQPLVVVDYYTEVADSEGIVVEDLMVEDIIIEDIVVTDLVAETEVAVVEILTAVAETEVAVVEILTAVAETEIAVAETFAAVAETNATVVITHNSARSSRYTIRPDEYVLSKDQIKGLPDYITLGRDKRVVSKVIGIEVTEKETLVDFIIKPSYDAGWLILSERTFLRDQTTNDMYKVRSIKEGIPLGKTLIINGRRGEYVCFTLVFPPLSRDVKKIDVIELASEITDSNTGWGWLRDDNLDVQELKIRRAKSVRIIE